MAASARFLSFFFFSCLTISCSLHVHARDSQFFSKVSANNKQEAELPNKEALLSKQEQDPTFIPDTQNGYGLYGHESGQLPPATTAAATTTTTTTPKVYPNTNANNNNYYNNEAYVTEPQGMSDTRFVQRGYTTPINSNNYYNGGNTYKAQQREGMGESKFLGSSYTTPTNGNNNHYYNNAQQQGMDRGYTTAPNGNGNYYTGGNNGYNVEKQGMSDTRFLENGKYYYDLKNENYNRNGYQNARTNSRNGYSSRGYYGNNNNENSYEYSNSMEGFRNQEEYPENQDDQFVP